MTIKTFKVFDRVKGATGAIAVICCACGKTIEMVTDEAMTKHLMRFHRSQMDGAICGQCQFRIRDEKKGVKRASINS